MFSNCQEHFDLWMRYYAWLLDEYGFVVIHTDTGHMNSCSFMLQSGDCRLFVSVDRGVWGFPQLALAPVAMQLDACAAGLRWYHIADIIDYLRGGYASWAQIEKQRRLLQDAPSDKMRSVFATEHRAFWPQVMALFQVEEFKRRHEALEAFLREKNENQERQRKESVRREEAEWLPKWRERQQQAKNDDNQD